MFKTAIVGCGAISKNHIEAIKDIQSTELAAFCDTNQENLQKTVEKYGGNAYSSLEEMLEKEQIDVLHICTPHYLHVPMALSALKKNVNVLMEKPPAISHEQFAQLTEAEKNSSARLGICFQNRYNSATQKAKKVLESGVLGKPLGARAIVTWKRGGVYYTESDWRGKIDREGGGVLINQSIHTLDLATYLLGMPSKITATSANYHLQGVINEEDTISAFIEYPDDKSIVFFATTAYCKSAPVLLEIPCENGNIRLENNTLRITYPDGKTEFEDCSTKNFTGKTCWGTGHKFIIEDYYKKLEAGEQFPITLESTRPSFETMMAIYDSAKTHKSIIPGEII